jgi:hypothetical protein
MKINYYACPAYSKLVDKENKRVGYEWEALMDKPYTESDVYKLIDKQNERQLKTYAPYKVNDR